MNLENIQHVELVLLVKQIDQGFIFKIDIFIDKQIKSTIGGGPVFKTVDLAKEAGIEVINNMAKEYNLNEHSVH